MKKLMIAGAALLVAATALAYSEHQGSLTLDDCSYDYTYCLYDGGRSNVVINLAKPIAPDVSIPSHIEGAPVVQIAGGRYAGAFGDCTNMTSIAIPSTIQTIGVCAFANCKDLVAVHITDLSAWCTVSIDYWSQTWSTPDYIRPQSNPLYFAQHLYLNGELVTDLVVPNGITSINGGFAYYTNLTSLVISDSVKQLSWGAFKRCTGLKSVDTGNGLTRLVDAAFSGCTNLEDLKIGTNITTLSSTTSRCEGPFYNTGLKDVTVPGNVKNISAYGNHYGYSNSNGPFAACPYLTNVVLQSGVCDVGENAFERSSRLMNIEIPNTVTNIGTRAFAQCGDLKSIRIPNSVVKIGNVAFGFCESLESITLSDNLKSIGYYAFKSCSKLTKVYIDDLAKWCQISFPIYDNDPSSVGHPLKDGAELYVAGVPVGKSLDIPYGVDRIASYAFYGMTNITSVTIPNSVETIGDGAFASCSALEDLSLGSRIKRLGNKAFYGCGALTGVDFTDTVTSIGEQAFSGCKSLTCVIVPDNVTSLGKSAFSNCSNLKTAVLGRGLNSVPSSTFSSCSKLERVTIKGVVTAIGGYAFIYCYALKGFQIPRTVTSIGMGAFSGCRELTNIELPENLMEMGEWAFSDCAGLTSVVFTGNAPTVGSSAFGGVKAGCTAYVPWGSDGWGVAIPGKWNGLDIAYLFTGKSEVAEEELPETVAVQSGADVTVRVNHEMLVAQLHALIDRCLAMPRDGRQDANYFRVKGDYDAAKSVVTLKAVIDEEKIGLDETLSEVASDEALSTFKEDGTMRLASVKDGFYYGLAAAGRLEDIDDAVESVKAGGLTLAVDGEVELSAEKPTGGAAFFKVVVSESER